MATRQSTVDLIVEQASEAGAVSARAMFGGHTLYCDGTVVGLICDDELFVKPTRAGSVHLAGRSVEERPPYNGAKPCFVIPGEWWEDRAWLSHLIRCTAENLPRPKARGRR